MKKWSKRKILIVTAVVIVVCSVGATGGYFYIKTQAKEDVSYQETELSYGDLELSFSEDGTTQIGTIDQSPEFDVTIADMEVEEVYASAGDTVAEGDALLKLTDESMAEATAYYEDAITSAQNTLEEAQNSYEVGVLEAEYDMETSLTEAQYADSSYAASLLELDDSVAEKKSSLEDAQTQIASLQSAISNNTYYTDNGIDEKNAAVTAAQQASATAQSNYDNAVNTYNTLKQSVSDEINGLTTSNLSTNLTQLQTDYAALLSAQENIDSTKNALEQAQSEVEKKQSELSQAQSKYEQSLQEANQKITQLSDSLSSLQSQYEQALRDAVTQKVTIKNTYNTTVLDGTYAKTTYDSAVASLKSSLDTAQETYNNLVEAQESLLSIEDGVVCASQAGTLSAVNYEAEDSLVNGTAFASYYNTDTIMISVEVDQSHISDVAVGDEVAVSISNVRGNSLTGTINSIASSATEDGSVSNVTYAVVIVIDNSDGSISSGLSASITFSYGSLSDVYYLPNDAVSDIEGTTGKVKQYDTSGNVVSVSVTVGEITDNYTVITEGMAEGDTCLIETGGEKDNEE